MKKRLKEKIDSQNTTHKICNESRKWIYAVALLLMHPRISSNMFSFFNQKIQFFLIQCNQAFWLQWRGALTHYRYHSNIADLKSKNKKFCVTHVWRIWTVKCSLQFYFASTREFLSFFIHVRRRANAFITYEKRFLCFCVTINSILKFHFSTSSQFFCVIQLFLN